jgi:hypothetical protein
LPAEIERKYAMKHQNNSLYGLFSTIFIVFVFIACQAEQPKTQKQTATEQSATVAENTDSGKAPIQSKTKLIVYYFHGYQRCPTCYKLENYAKSEVENDFADAIKKGKIEWKTINVEEKGNEHFSNDYKLYTKSVIVSTINNGKESSWKNLDQIWQLVHDESTYREYIRNEVKACLQEKCL